MITFEKLENRYEFTGTLVLKEATHIGSGEGDARTDSTFVKSRSPFKEDPVIYLPGSSLRGVLRSTVERIVAALDKTTCFMINNPNSICVTANPEILKKEKEKYEKQNGGKDWSETHEFEFLEDHLCETCKLFGSTHFASRVKITDLYPVDQTSSVAEGNIRHGVGIDRDTETAKDGALFDIETIDKGKQFQFEMIVENVEDTELGLLGIGIMEMLNGKIHIGAKSAAGLGKCKLKTDNFEIKYFEGKDELKKYLTNGYPNTKSGNEAKNWIKEKVTAYLE